MPLSAENLDDFDRGVAARLVCVECGENGLVCICLEGPHAWPSAMVDAIRAEKEARDA